MLLLLACTVRPDGDFETLDGPEGLVRVHFTREGADAVDPTDEDGDGLPDRAELAATTAEAAIRFYEVEGFPRPVGDDGVGGSDALDVYIVQPRSVSPWGVTHCGLPGAPCYIEISPTEQLVEMLVAHEVFHASAAAYGVEPDTWLGESAAIWMGGKATATGSAWRDLWNQHHTCAIGGVEVGSDCLAAVYGFELWWEFIERTRGPEVLVRTWEILAEGGSGVDALEAALAEVGTSLEEEWPTVANWNLATGELADSTAGFENAESLRAPPLDDEGETLHLTVVIEPLSIRYYRLDHPGGHVWIGAGGDARYLRVSLHPAAIDLNALAFGLPANGDLDLGEQAAGPVYLVVSNPSPHGIVTPIQLCVDSQPCEPGCGNLGFAWIGVGLLRIRGLRRPARPRPTRPTPANSPRR